MYLGSVVPFIAGPLHMQKYVDISDDLPKVMHSEYRITNMRGMGNFAVYLHESAFTQGVSGWKDLSKFAVTLDFLLKLGMDIKYADKIDAFFVNYSVACLTYPSAFLLNPQLFYGRIITSGCDIDKLTMIEFNKMFHTFFFKEKLHLISTVIDHLSVTYPDIFLSSSLHMPHKHRKISPLHHTIYEELTRVLKPKNLLELELLGLSLARYTNSTPYLFSILKGKPRLTLAGEEKEVPTDHEKARAHRILRMRKAL